jgi:hypothetical protein
MWPYYGSKTNIAKYYPLPRYGKIIEPFAGTARYALRHFEHDVLIVDKWDVIVKIWKWLQQCSPDDVLKLPRLKEGERVSSYTYDCEEAKLLMGFLAGKAVEAPRDKASARATTQRPNYINFSLKRIAANLFKIRHWEIRLGSYEDLPNEEATWFIDPPYQVGGHVYKHHSIDYSSLAEWCKARAGQVIVCENTQADWLPFLPMRAQKGSVRWTIEAIWCNHQTAYHFQQTSLFSQATP